MLDERLRDPDKSQHEISHDCENPRLPQSNRPVAAGVAAEKNYGSTFAKTSYRDGFGKE
jgi:hypothetical protein